MAFVNAMICIPRWGIAAKHVTHDVHSAVFQRTTCNVKSAAREPICNKTLQFASTDARRASLLTRLHIHAKGSQPRSYVSGLVTTERYIIGSITSQGCRYKEAQILRRG